MKEQYLRQVARRLSLSRRKKREVLRDLEEAFASAQEHGETEEKVLERLGSPEEFCAGVEEQLGVRQGRGGTAPILLTACGAVLLGLFAAAQAGRPPEGAIGQADAATTIQVESAFPFDPAWLLLGLAALLLLWAAALVLRRRRKERGV